MSTKLFSNKQRAGVQMVATALDHLVQGIQTEVNSHGHQLVSKSIARNAFSMESMNPTDEIEIDRSVNSLNTALESIVSTHGKGFAPMTQAQKDAGVAAAIISGDIPGFIRAPIVRNVVASESLSFISPTGGDFTSDRMKAAMEAYDEKENKNAVVYSVAYNMQAARQDEFGETFFPTVVVTPDQVGFTMSIRLIRVYDDMRRQISGNVDKFNFKNIVQAVIDPTILQNDLMLITPVFRTESQQFFVDPALLPPKTVVISDGESVTTSAYAVGKTFSLLGISQTAALLETGLQDTTDSIDTSIKLANIYMQLGSGANAEVISFPTASLPLATFTYSVQENYRQMILNFNTSSLLVNAKTTDVSGAASTILAPVVAGGYQVRLGISVSGKVNLQLADTNVYSSSMNVVSVFDNTGTALDITTGNGLTIANLFAGATMIGYDLEARRTNMNRRQRGQLLDTTFYNQVYAVPLRSPITVPRPLTIGDANDSSDLAALITATHIRTSNEAVAELLRVESYLAEYVGPTNLALLGTPAPEILGVARFLVSPFYESDSLDVNTQIDSLKSHERAADIQAVLVNKLRDMAYRMYRDSGYKAAADALAGGIAPTPTVIIGTDPVISRYLTVTGDFRTLGNDFNVKIVSTLNRNMAGKIIMSFGVFDSGMDGVPNPMHFGNMAWKPELTLVLPLHRNGANSKELTVQPSFLHVTNLPIMSSVTVTGISDVAAAKVPVYTHSV